MLTSTNRDIYAASMQSYERDAAEHDLMSAPQLPPTITSVFGSVKRSGRFSVPSQLHLKAAFAELRLDLRDALFPEREVLLVCESLCASVKVLLPEGVSVVDHSTSLFSSQKVLPTPEAHGPIIHLDGWSLCSDVKVSDFGRSEALGD
jgi:hypothetical protein